MKLLNEVTKSPELDVVRVVYLGDNDEVLLVQEYDDENWKLPGGKMHSGETVLQAMIREIEEELGFTPDEADIKNLVKAHIPHNPNFRYIFLAKLDMNKIKQTDEVNVYKLFPVQEIPDGKFKEHIQSAIELVS